MNANTLITKLAGSLAACLFLSLPLTTTATEVAKEGAEVGQWTMDYEAALDLAETKDIPLLLNFTGSDWCGWCQLMDEQVYAKPAWKDYAADHLLLVTLDFPRDKSIVPAKYVERNEELREEFQVQGYPTYIILDSDGETVLGQLGAGREKTPESFIEEVEDMLRYRPANVEAKIEELGPEKGAEYKAALNEVRDAEQALKDWIETGPERSPENDEKFQNFQEDIFEAREKVASF